MTPENPEINPGKGVTSVFFALRRGNATRQSTSLPCARKIAHNKVSGAQQRGMLGKMAFGSSVHVQPG
jgi:hypothetical protein